MTHAMHLSPDARDATHSVARGIGQIFRAARLEHGDQQKDIAARVGIMRERVSLFETGSLKNPQLGYIVRMLNLYDLTLAVVPLGSPMDQHRDTRTKG